MCRYRISGYGQYEGGADTAFMQLYPTEVDVPVTGAQSAQGGVFGAAFWHGPCASIVVLQLPNATVTAEVKEEELLATVTFQPASAGTTVTCPYIGAAHVIDPGVPEKIEAPTAAS